MSSDPIFVLRLLLASFFAFALLAVFVAMLLWRLLRPQVHTYTFNIHYQKLEAVHIVVINPPNFLEIDNGVLTLPSINGVYTDSLEDFWHHINVKSSKPVKQRELDIPRSGPATITLHF